MVVAASFINLFFNKCSNMVVLVAYSYLMPGIVLDQPVSNIL